MTPHQFIDGLFGPGWTESQLPVFLDMLRTMQDDARRYHELREILARKNDWIADRKSLNSVDEYVDAARQSGFL
jgi:hypothetical protein